MIILVIALVVVCCVFRLWRFVLLFTAFGVCAAVWQQSAVWGFVLTASLVAALATIVHIHNEDERVARERADLRARQ